MTVPRMRTVQQCAAFFKEQDPGCCIGEWCIRQLVNQGKIPVCRSGRRILINLDMLIEYYATGEADQASDPATVTRIH
ncbi:helix-turn-helix domain-containing protein [Lacrimispora brassicae]